MKMARYKVTTGYESPYPVSISFKKGESITVGEEFGEDPDWKGWRRCEASNNRKAWVPEQYIVSSGKKSVLNRDYDAKEISIRVGETVTVHEAVNGFGLAENVIGETGWVPLRNLCIIR